MGLIYCRILADKWRYWWVDTISGTLEGTRIKFAHECLKEGLPEDFDAVLMKEIGGGHPPSFSLENIVRRERRRINRHDLSAGYEMDEYLGLFHYYKRLYEKIKKQDKMR